jgi:hypothetical protein
MTTRLPKIASGLLAAATLAASLTAFTSPAQAWHGHGFGFGLGFGAAALGAAAVASSYDGPYDNCRLVNTYDRRGNFLGTVKRCW